MLIDYHNGYSSFSSFDWALSQCLIFIKMITLHQIDKIASKWWIFIIVTNLYHNHLSHEFSPVYCIYITFEIPHNKNELYHTWKFSSLLKLYISMVDFHPNFLISWILLQLWIYTKMINVYKNKKSEWKYTISSYWWLSSFSWTFITVMSFNRNYKSSFWLWWWVFILVKFLS